MSYQKSNQLKKTKKTNPKKMPKSEYRQHCNHIREISFGNCQICKHAGEDMHHSIFGNYGANKDDRSIVLVCRECHDKCHKDREFNQKAILIGAINYESRNL